MLNKINIKTYIGLYACLSLGVPVAFTQHAEAIRLNLSTSEYVEYAPTVSADGKIMIFQSNRDGKFKLYQSKLQKDSSWSAPEALKEINEFQGRHSLIGGPSLSADGQRLYFCAMAEGGLGSMDIYYCDWKKDRWWYPKNLGAPVNTPAGESFPVISPDGKKLYFTSTTVNADNVKCSKIMVAELSDKDRWENVREVSAPINTACDKSAFVPSYGQHLFFASDRPGGKGAEDLYRLSQEGTVQSLDFLNSSAPESAPAVSKAEDWIYYACNGDLYKRKIPNSFRVRGIRIDAEVLDEETLKPLTNVKFSLLDSLTRDTLWQQLSSRLWVDLMPGQKYKLVLSSPNYLDLEKNITVPETAPFRLWTEPLKLRPRRKKVVFKVSDAESKKALKVKIKITNTGNQEVTYMDQSVGRDGNYTINLREGGKYNVEVSSLEGYAFTRMDVDVPLSSEVNLSTNSQNIPTGSGADTLAGAMAVDVKVQPLRDGTKLALKDIYFGFNKSQLDPASYEELNRVVVLMNTNPSALIEIAAHTDDVGSADFNLKLSEKRAQEIVAYLKSKGVAPGRLKARGYGKAKPVAQGNTEEARARNRRVELKIIDIK